MQCFLLCILCAFGVSGQFQSTNYFRYGSVSWKRVNISTNHYQVEFNLLIGLNNWPYNPRKVVNDSYSFESNQFQFGDGSTRSLTSKVVQVNSGPFLENLLFFVNPIFTHVYNSSGPWVAQVVSTDFARWNQLSNNDLKRFRLQCKINLANGNNFSPKVATPPQVFLEPGFTDWKITAWDFDNHNVTYRLSTPYELGDLPSQSSDGSGAQISQQPEFLSINSSTGQIVWPPQSPRRPVAYYNLQVMVADGNGAEVPVDFVLRNKVQENSRPVIGGGETPITDSAETILLGSSVEFTIEVTNAKGLEYVRSTEPINVVNPIGTIQPLVGVNRSKQNFQYTPVEAGLQRLCFYAMDLNATDSLVYCFDQFVLAVPEVNTQWTVPTVQVQSQEVRITFRGLFLDTRDRISWVLNSSNCSTLQPSSGTRVQAVWDFPVRRVRSRLNTRFSNVTLVMPGFPTYIRFCYQLHSNISLPWQMVTAPDYRVTAEGPYRLHSLVSRPVSNKVFRYLVDGVSLQRFDRVVFLRPSAPPPATSSITCENTFGMSDGTMVKDFPMKENMAPGFIRGAEEASWPWIHNLTDAGLYVCYRPANDQWRLLDYVTRPLVSGIFKVVSSVSPILDVLNVTLQGLALHSSDTWLATPTKDWSDCNVYNNDSLVNHTNSTNLTTIVVNGTALPGLNIFSLCYKHLGIVSKIAELPLRDTPYGFLIPDPLTTTPLYSWVDFSPYENYVNESVTYTFTGYEPFSYNLNPNGPCIKCKYIMIKVAAHGSCQGVTPGGEGRMVDRDRRVPFKISKAGTYRFCIKHRNDWEPVARPFIIVERPEARALEPFRGYQTCEEWIRNNATADTCGCWIDFGPQFGEFVDIPTTFLPEIFTSNNLNVNQGCCDNPSAERGLIGKIVTPPVTRGTWGYCKHTPIVSPIPFPPYSTPGCD